MVLHISMDFVCFVIFVLYIYICILLLLLQILLNYSLLPAPSDIRKCAKFYLQVQIDLIPIIDQNTENTKYCWKFCFSDSVVIR